MTPHLIDEEAAIFAELRKWGEDNVRHLLASNQHSLVYHGPALRWIEEIDRASTEESERRKLASQAEQIRVARRAKNAARIAAIAAIIAAIIATIGAFISYLAWYVSALCGSVWVSENKLGSR